MAQLIVVEGPNRGKTFDIPQGAVSIGRAATNTIVLDDRRAGESQAEIRCSKTGYEIVNLDQKKNLLVNGEIFKKTKLQHGDWITIADTTLVFSEDLGPRPAHDVRPMSTDDLMATSIQARRLAPDDADSVIESVDSGIDKDRAARRLQTLLRVSHALSDTLNLQQLLDKVLDLCFAVFPADQAFILLLDDESRKLKPMASKVRSGGGGTLNYSRTIIREVFTRREAVLSSDAMDDQRFLSGQSIMEHSIRAVMCVPFVFKDRMLGVMQLDSTSETQAFSAEDLDLLVAIATQASMAIDNSKAYKRQQEYSRNLFQLGKITQKLSSYLDRDRLLKEVVKCACSLLSCTKGSIVLAADETQAAAQAALSIPCAIGINRDLWAKIDAQSIGSRFARRVIQSGEPMLVGSLKETETGIEPNARYQTDSFLIVPIYTKGRAGDTVVIGAICVTDKLNGGAFSGTDQEMLQIVASQTGIALANADLYERATQDSLTRIFVRRYFMQKIEEEVERHGIIKKPLSLIMGDVDHFKHVNDTYGHQAGDAVLYQTAQLLKRSVREDCTVARYGGEEFSIILPETPEDIARKVAERIRHEVEAYTYRTPEAAIRRTISLGVATLSNGDSKDHLIRKADLALYAAKNGGRNRVEVYQSKTAQKTPTGTAAENPAAPGWAGDAPEI